MDFKKIITDTKKKVQDAIDDYNDPEKKQERDIKKAMAAMEAAEKGTAAYKSAKEALNKAKEAVASKVEEVEPVAKQAFEEGKKKVTSLIEEWKNKDVANSNQENKPKQQPKNPKNGM